MNLSISISCADINEAMDVLKKLSANTVTDVVVQAATEAPAPTGSKGIPVPAKATRAPRAKSIPAPVAVEEVDPATDAPVATEAVLDHEPAYKAALAEARKLLVGKGVGTKEKALVMAIKSQCLALTGSEDTNAVVDQNDMLDLTNIVNAEIAKYKGV